MTIYTIRQDFVIQIDGETYTGGQTVDLSEEQFQNYQHMLEGTGDTGETDDQTDSNGSNDDGNDTPIYISDFPALHISAINLRKLLKGDQAKILISGSYFTENTVVSSEAFTVNSTVFLSDNLIEINVSVTPNLGSFNLLLDNGKTTEVSNAFEVIDSLYWDFREGFDEPYEISDTTSITATDYWLEVAEINAWDGGIRFKGESDRFIWSRNTAKSISWILFNEGIVGIGSPSVDLSALVQLYYAEILGYFDNTLNRINSNDGTPGDFAAQNIGVPKVSAEIVKFTIENNGTPGASYKVYDLTPNDEGWQESGLTRQQFLSKSVSTSGFFSEEKLIMEEILADNLLADEPLLLPYCVSGLLFNSKLLGFYLEDFVI